MLIYVTEGYISVTEEDQYYLIQKEELFFLKSGLHHQKTADLAGKRVCFGETGIDVEGTFGKCLK